MNAAGQGPLIEFSVKSQQGEFFIRKAKPCGPTAMGLFLSPLISLRFTHFVGFQNRLPCN